MSTTNNSLGSSPLSADHVDGYGNPLFNATPRRAQSMGSTLVSVVGAERLIRLVLDELTAITGRRFDGTETLTDLIEAAELASVELSGIIGQAEDTLAAEAILCPCGHRYHPFDACLSCECIDGPS